MLFLLLTRIKPQGQAVSQISHNSPLIFQYPQELPQQFHRLSIVYKKDALAPEKDSHLECLKLSKG